MSVTENFWRSVWLLVSGDTSSREPGFHSLSGRIIKIWSTSVPLRDLTPVRPVGLFSSAVLILQSRLDPALRIWSLTPSHASSARQKSTENILPQRCVVGAASWGVEQAVRRALLHVTRPARAPEGTLFVPEVVRSTVLRWGHSSKLMAHPGIRGTLAAISQRFWWPTRERDVRRFVGSCQVCAQTKSSNSPPAGLLRPLPIPSRPWSHIALDFVTGLPLSAGNTVILTVVDRFSKAAHFIPLPKLPSARETAQVMVDHVFRIHGLPSDIVSDRGPQFASQFWKEFCHQIGASPALSSGFHPQTNGQAERTNQILGRMLRSLTSRTPASWCDQLAWAEYAHNTLPSSATGLSPFECCLGYQPPLFASQESQSSVPSVERFIQRCKRTWRRVRSALCRTRTRTRRVPIVTGSGPPGMFVVRRCGFPPAISPSRRVLASWCPALLGPFLLLRFSVRSRSNSDCPVSCAVFTRFFTCPASNLFSSLRPAPPFPLLLLTRRLLFTESVSSLTCALVGVVTSFWWTGRGTVLRRGVGFRPGTSWIARWSRTSTVLVRLLSRERLVALVERGVLSWSGFASSFFLSLTLLYTHSHTHTHTHAYWHLHLSLSPTCLLFQSVFALLCSATCFHSFNQSLYFTAAALVALCRIIVYRALYVFSCFFIVLNLVPCLVSPGDAESFWCFLGVLLPLPVSPVPWSLPWLISLEVLFSIFSVLRLRTTDCLVFCSFIKDCVYYPFAFGSFHSRCDKILILL